MEKIYPVIKSVNFCADPPWLKYNQTEGFTNSFCLSDAIHLVLAPRRLVSDFATPLISNKANYTTWPFRWLVLDFATPLDIQMVKVGVEL